MTAQLAQIAPNVWVFPPDPDPAQVQPAVGVISTATRTILVDAGNGPRHARRIAAALADIDAPPVRAVIYTHHHWDHVFGANAFGVPAIAHDHCRALLLHTATEPWSERYLRDAIAWNPLLEMIYTAMGRAVDDWRGFAVVVPTVTFSHTMRLHVDEVSIELEHVGGQHAEDSIVVRVPEAQVLFLGDCVYPPPLHLRTPDAAPDWAMLRRFLEDEAIELYLGAHNREPASKADLRALLAGAGPREGR